MANGSLSAFLKQNKKETGIVKYAATESFVDTKGKPLEWQLKPITATLDEALRKECTKKVPTGKRGQTVPELDVDAYLAKLCVASTVFPNLNDKELQDSYNDPANGVVVMDAQALLKAMLNAGEYTDYKMKVSEINGFDVSMDELVEEAKN